MIEIRELVPRDVDALAACVRRCYGSSYSLSDFYDLDWLRSQLATGRLLSVGACVGQRIVGHIGVSVVSPGDPVGDTVAGIVEPSFRGQGLVRQMGEVLFSAFTQRGIVATRHIATGAHLRTQRPLAESGAVETGVLLGHLPASTDYHGVGRSFGGARIGAVVFFQSHGDIGILDVHVAPRYHDAIGAIYRRAGLVRRIIESVPPQSRAGSARAVASINVRSDSHAGVSTIGFSAEPDHRLSTERLDAVLTGNVDVEYVDVPLCHVDGPQIVEWLRCRSFAFGSLLPGTASTERLRMQRVSATTRPDLIQFATPEGRRLRNWIVADLSSREPRR